LSENSKNGVARLVSRKKNNEISSHKLFKYCSAIAYFPFTVLSSTIKNVKMPAPCNFCLFHRGQVEDIECNEMSKIPHICIEGHRSHYQKFFSRQPYLANPLPTHPPISGRVKRCLLIGIGVKEVLHKQNLDGAKRSLLHRVIRCWSLSAIDSIDYYF